MKAIKETLPRFKPMLGWANRILRIDLSAGRIWAEETAPRVPSFIGARGLAAKILWDEYPEPVDPFDPRNPLMVMPGALTGTIAPYSGRTNVCAFSPQCAPYPWFTRASIGGHWGAHLKRAGYDGLVVTGSGETPLQIVIQDDEVSILPADELWGLDIIETQEAIQDARGRAARTLAIGPAGERLSRIATIQTGTTSVAGQGGFGAVMGAKKLKAITVLSSGRVPVADPERLKGLFRAVGQEVRPTRGRWHRIESINQTLAQEGGGTLALRWGPGLSL
jgi:aldehyde:ferredoxin oxidoreductase